MTAPAPTEAGLRRKQAKALKREQILAEATSLFHEHGYERTSIDMIAERFGMTKPYVYYHFSTKAAILEEVCVRPIRDSAEVIEREIAAGESATTALIGIVRGVARIVTENPKSCGVFFREERALPPDTLARINEYRHRFDTQFARLLKRGAASGEFRIGDASVTGLAIAGMISWMYVWYRPNGRMSDDDLAEHFVALALRMVSRDPERNRSSKR